MDTRIPNNFPPLNQSTSLAFRFRFAVEAILRTAICPNCGATGRNNPGQERDLCEVCGSKDGELPI